MRRKGIKMGRLNPQLKCNICDRDHYARGYCRKHYNNLMAGRIIQPVKCITPGCKTLVIPNMMTGRKDLPKDHKYTGKHCAYCELRMYMKIHAKYKGDGGIKWGYKDYRTIKKWKKKTCKKCGKRKGLVITHRDGDKRNSKRGNIVTLCRSCTAHAATARKVTRLKAEVSTLTAEVKQLKKEASWNQRHVKHLAEKLTR